MVFTSDFSINLFDFSSQSARSLAQTGDVLPLATISPDGGQVAFLGSTDPAGAGTPQLMLTDRSGNSTQPVIEVPAAVVSDLLWVEN